MPSVAKRSHLLAVDLGLRSGTALYGEDGRLRAYQSLNFQNREEMKRKVPKIVAGIEDLEWLVSEGETSMAAMWERSAMRRGVRVSRVDGETWRATLDLAKASATSADSRRAAQRLARRILDWAEMPQPVVLPSDAAEAICVGLWAVHSMGWLAELPVERQALQRIAQPNRRLLARVANG